MLVANSETRLGSARIHTTLLLERAVRATIVRRDQLSYDTKFAAAAPGRVEPVGHLFMVLAGRLVTADGVAFAAPVAMVLADEEFERVRPTSRTFRTEGPRVELVQLRAQAASFVLPIGLAHGAVALPAPCWDAARAMLDGANDRLDDLLARLAAASALRDLRGTLMSEEPEHFVRLWSALEPLFQAQGAATSAKQLAAKLGLSLRQTGRDAKELAATFGMKGYREALLVLRLRTAALLLSAQGATIGQVADAVGYGSAIAMARAFRDAKLPSPSAIRDEYIGTPA